MAVALWVLVTAIEAADPGVATPRRCLLSHYGSLDPRALAAVKALRDRYARILSSRCCRPRPEQAGAPTPPLGQCPEGAPCRRAGHHLGPSGCLRKAKRLEVPSASVRALREPRGSVYSPHNRPARRVPRAGIPAAAALRGPGEEAQPHAGPVPQEEETLSWRPHNCSFRPRRDRPRPWSCARLRVVVRDLADAQAVLSRLPSPDRFPGTGPTLELLAAARRDVGACLELVRPGSWRKSLRPPRRRPPTRRADSPRCHEANVIFNLLRLLTWDLKLVANSGPCL
ncbi:interferon lambda-4-like [Mustela putorius furo]|uniref:Interferon lambda-4-like n=1 Tax=Mustela putorius furo TaxID=9669 RepID=A0A8U0RYJ7_MUSPF|nr:interferon lambda-4-like [Mustela putorius furo]